MMESRALTTPPILKTSHDGRALQWPVARACVIHQKHPDEVPIMVMALLMSHAPGCGKNIQVIFLVWLVRRMRWKALAPGAVNRAATAVKRYCKEPLPLSYSANKYNDLIPEPQERSRG